MAAKVSVLSELHGALATMLLEEIRLCKEAEIPMSASDKAVIIKFLKDNDITAEIDKDELSELKQEFEDELANRRKAKVTAILDAAESDDKYKGVL